MTTWGYRVVAIPDGDETSYGLREVFYDDKNMPEGMGDVLLYSPERDFRDLRQKLDEAIRRPLHDPDNPVPAPRSYREVDLGYMPGSEEDKMIPLTLPEIIAYQRHAASDLRDAIATQADTLVPDMLAMAKMDREFALRIAKTLAAIPDLDAIRNQLYGYLDQARALTQGIESADLPPVIDQIDGLLENAQGLLAMIGLPPGPDGCQVCKGAKGGAPGNENVVDGVLMCDYCDAARPRGKPPGANCWVTPPEQGKPT